jgi:hypothetical protein
MKVDPVDLGEEATACSVGGWGDGAGGARNSIKWFRCTKTSLFFRYPIE